MAQLGKLVFGIKDSAGNALSGVSVEVRKQGAQVNGAHAGSNTTFTVDDPGAIVATDNVRVNTGTVTTRSVSSVTGTTVVVGAPGFDDLIDDDRLTDITLPTVYEDAVGNTSKTNALTTDAAGEAFCWVVGGKYDVLVSGGGATTKLYTDIAAVGGESRTSTIYSGTAWKLDSVRALAAADLLLDVSTAGVNKFKVMGDGEVVAGAAGATHNLTGTLTTSTTITATAGNIQATAGDFDGRRLKMDNGTSLVIGDFTLSAGWGTTAIISLSQVSYDTRGVFSISANGAGIASDPTVKLIFKDGTYTVAPVTVIIRSQSTSAPTTAFWTQSVSSATQVIWQFVGLPVSGNTYEASYIVIG